MDIQHRRQTQTVECRTIVCIACLRRCEGRNPDRTLSTSCCALLLGETKSFASSITVDLPDGEVLTFNRAARAVGQSKPAMRVDKAIVSEGPVPVKDLMQSCMQWLAVFRSCEHGSSDVHACILRALLRG